MFDIEYLLLLQKLRENLGPAAEKIAAFISDLPFGIFTVTLVLATYWSISKKTGTFILLSQATGGLLVNFIKLCACVYRPWIRDSRIHPAGDAFKTATGYSFPSGHSQSSTDLYGAFGFATWKKNKILSVIFWIFVPVIMFTRNFLGVHTPQDVLTGFALGLAVLFLIDFLTKWEGRGKNRDLIILVSGLVFAAAVLLIISLKKYPLDYVEGKLLVDPALMKKDCFNAAGTFIFTLTGWFIEKRWIKFSTEGSILQKILRVICGLLVIGALALGFSLVKKFLHPYFYYFIKYGVLFFTAIAGYPAIFTAVEKAIAKRKAQ